MEEEKGREKEQKGRRKNGGMKISKKCSNLDNMIRVYKIITHNSRILFCYTFYINQYL